MKTNVELQKDVMAEIKWDPQLSDVASEIGVAAKDGVITLSGMVNTYTKKLAAERAAQRVQGVKVVAVDIVIKPTPFGVKSDTEIAVAVKNALQWNSAVNEDKIEIKVDDGWVYLSGTVEWEYQRKTAQSAVEDLVGVKGVTNNIILKSVAIDAKELKNKIGAAFQRSATLDSSNIHIEISGSRVTLTGTVRSWTEKRDAERVVWSSPGVLTVDNKIAIDTEVFV